MNLIIEVVVHPDQYESFQNMAIWKNMVQPALDDQYFYPFFDSDQLDVFSVGWSESNPETQSLKGSDLPAVLFIDEDRSMVIDKTKMISVTAFRGKVKAYLNAQFDPDTGAYFDPQTGEGIFDLGGNGKGSAFWWLLGLAFLGGAAIRR